MLFITAATNVQFGLRALRVLRARSLPLSGPGVVVVVVVALVVVVVIVVVVVVDSSIGSSCRHSRRRRTTTVCACLTGGESGGKLSQLSLKNIIYPHQNIIIVEKTSFDDYSVHLCWPTI